MTVRHATSGVAVTAAAVVAGRYLRDLRRARARLARLERRSTATPFGPLEYCEWGEGEPLLLVHGVVGGCDVPPSWRALVPAGYRIITPSRFGYLGSPLPEATSTARQADAFAHLFDALRIARAPVLAFSAGSTSAVQLALRHPDRVSALVLVAANSPHEKPVTLAPRALAPLVFSQPTLWFLRVFLPSKLAAIAGKPAGYVLSEEDGRTLETIFDSFFPIRERAKGIIFDGYVGNPEIGSCAFEQITVPTLGVHAADDPLASYEDARAMVARIPGSRWLHVERGGHIFIHNDEQATAEIAAFLAANAPSLWVGALLANMDISAGHLAAATLSAVLLALAYGAIAVLLGAATGKRTVAIGLTAAAAVAAYLVNGLAPLVHALEVPQKLSPFYHYAVGDPLRNGVSLTHMAVLVAIAVAATALAPWFFSRRDVAT